MFRARATHHSQSDRAPAILFAHPSTELYGSDRQLVESVTALLDAGWTTTVCLPADGPLRTLLGSRVQVVRFAVLRKSLAAPRRFMGLLAGLPGDLVRVVRVIRALRPDVVYVNTVTIPIWVLAARVCGVPSIVHVHEAESDAPVLQRLALTVPLLAARAVVANSNAARDVVIGTVGRLAERTSVVVNGVPDPGAEPGPETPGQVYRLALIARLSPRKGVDVALEAVAAARAAGTPVTLDICGTAFAGYEWFEQQLRDRARQPDLAGSVTFRGYVDPTAPVLAAATAVLVPSRVEPFGNTAVEGMLAGRPVIASDVQGLTEIITDEVTGLLVAPGDAAALAAAIVRVCREPELASRLSRAGRAAATDRFTVTRYRREIAAIADRLAVNAPSSAELVTHD